MYVGGLKKVRELRLRRRLVWCVAVPVMTALLWSCGGPKEPTEEPPSEPDNLVKVEVVEVRPTPINDILILPGETKPWQDVTVASDVGGLVESVEFKEGDKVKKGDLLAKIDVSALKAVLDSAQADLDMAQKHFKRRQELHNREIISQEELDQSRTSLLVKQGIANQAKVAHENGLIHSPIDGVINDRYADAGEFVGQGAPIMNVVNVDRLEIEVNVPELDVRYLESGQQAMVRVDAFPDMTTGGLIKFVAFKADPATKTFRVNVMVDNAGGKVRPGMIARVIFLRRAIPDALVAPLFALVDKEGERLVFIEKDGKARARTVSLGVIEGDRIQITKGLEPGDRLIVVGHTQVEDGTPVQVSLEGPDDIPAPPKADEDRKSDGPDEGGAGDLDQ